MFGWQEWIVIILVVLLVFGGAAKLPHLARSLGEAMQEFKKAVKNAKKTKEDIIETVIGDELDDNKKKRS